MESSDQKYLRGLIAEGEHQKLDFKFEINDARKIARQKGLDPNRWSALEQTLPLLRLSKFYKDTTYGYCRGTEPVRFVRRVLTYYDIIKRESIGSV